MQFPTMAIDGLHRPIIPLLVESAAGHQLIVDALVDTGSDITVFPEAVAQALGIDLTEAAQRSVSSALGVVGIYREAEVTLELRRVLDEVYRWKATVGFLPRSMAYSMLGTTGFFEFFALKYDAPQHMLEIEPFKPLPS